MRKISILPIGTCRINTPLKRGTARYPVQLDFRRIYGFVHTSEEAVQQLRYRSGDLSFPEAILPILFRPGLEHGIEPVPERPADLAIIEISSAKSYMIGDIAVQGNYLRRHFDDFFASVPRARKYRELARLGDAASMQTFLAKDPTYRLYSEADQDLLSRIRMREQTFDDVRADMATMVDMLGKDRVLFVTHVNAVTPDGNIIASRDKLIHWVKRAAGDLGVECFDPTDLMNTFGQARALEREGLDLTHFTNPFCDRWYAAVQRNYVLKSLAEGDLDEAVAVQFDAAILAESIATSIAHDDFFDGAHQLFAAMKVYPDNVALHLLHGQVLARIGDFEGACRVLAPHVAAPEMTAELRQALMRAQFETGDAGGALALASQLLTDEYETVEIYEIAGKAADRLGFADDALRYRKLAFRLDPANHAAAIAVLEHYSAAGDHEAHTIWLAEVLDQLEARGPAAAARALAEWALTRKEPAALGRAMVSLARRDMVQIPAIVEETVRAGLQSVLMTVAAPIMTLPNLTENVRRVLQQIASGWAAEAERLEAAGQMLEALTFAKATLGVLSRNGPARRLRRALAGNLLAKVRAASGEAEVVALCEASGELVYDLRATAQAYSRALVNLDRLAEAQVVAGETLANDPDSIEARANLAHIANLNGDFLTALKLYAGLADEPDEATARHRIRIDRFMASAGSRGIRKIRGLLGEGNNGEAVAIWQMLGARPDHAAAMAVEALRIRSALRSQLRRIDDEEDERAAAGSTLAILDYLLVLAPEDTVMLRRAALEAMKQQQFQRAAAYWRRLDSVTPGLHEVSVFLERCSVRARRQARDRAASPVGPQLAA